MEQLFLLVFGHALADTALQNRTMSIGKNRHRNLELHGWIYWMSAHAILHGGIVYLITGSLLCGLLETAFHWMIDLGKCERLFPCWVDQGLHGICKLLYLL